MSQENLRCYFCNHQAEYDEVVKKDLAQYMVAGVCKDHLTMGLSS